MSAVGDLLPASQGTFEAALADAMSDSLPVPIKEVMDPATTPAPFLPWLAVHYGARLWFSDWSEARKRLVVGQAPAVNFTIGTRAAVVSFLSYVDGALLDAKSYPHRFVLGRAVVGRTPLQHHAFVARFLVKVETSTPRKALVLGRGVLGRHAWRTPSREKFKRVMAALRAAKSPETQYRVNFQHKRQITIADNLPLDGSYKLGDFIARVRL